MNQQIKEIIRDAEMVLVGIGEECALPVPSFGCGAELEPFYRSRYCAEVPGDHEILQAYNRLRQMIGAKPYFVVTLNTDDLIWRSDFEPDLIVAPCGSMAKMQCAEHIVEAAPVRERVIAAWEECRRSDAVSGGSPSSDHEAACEADGQVSDGAAPDGATVEPREQGARVKKLRCGEAAGEPVARYAVCPECGRPLTFHTVAADNYLEAGYLSQWNHYTRWLSCTLNRKLCILELGTGFSYPQVIRWPFEKTAYFNQKATLVRVSSQYPQLPAELGGRGVSVQEQPVAFLLGE